MSKELESVANFFIYKNNQEKIGLTNKKLQKLVYYSQAWYLAFFGKEIFKEPIEAWVHGPAIPSLYFQYKDYGFGEIKQSVDIKSFSTLGDQIIKFLENIWEVYGKFDGEYLEILSHSELPWQEARKGVEEHVASSNHISLNTMRTFYGQKIG